MLKIVLENKAEGQNLKLFVYIDACLTLREIAGKVNTFHELSFLVRSEESAGPSANRW